MFFPVFALEPPTSPSALEQVAAAYYGQGAARPAAPEPSRVEDIQGRPLAGVSLRAFAGDRAVGGARTGESGILELAFVEPNGSVLLRLEAPGYLPASATSSGQPERITLARSPARVHDALLSEVDPVERLWWALELVSLAADAVSSDDELFPYLGPALPELRQIAASPSFARPDLGLRSPATRAQALLALWGDPADASLLPADLQVKTPKIRGADPYAVCAAYDPVHRAQERMGPNHHGECYGMIRSVEGDRALVRYRVEYLAWGYEFGLVVAPEGEVWALQRAAMSLRWHNEIQAE